MHRPQTAMQRTGNPMEPTGFSNLPTGGKEKSVGFIMQLCKRIS